MAALPVSAATPASNARTIAPPRTASGSSWRTTTWIHGWAAASSAAKAAVPSLEPFSTITHSAGSTVCAATHGASARRFSASFRAGVTRAYARRVRVIGPGP